MTDVKEMTAEHIDEMLSLVAYAFQWELSENNRKRFGMLAENSWNFGSFDEENRLASQVMATPFKVDLFGDQHLMAGIGFVASYPEYRSQGRIDRIMTELLAVSREKGVNLSYLAPFSYPFYRRYGYELTFERAVYDVPASQWPDSPKVSGRVERLSWRQAEPLIGELFAAAERHHRGGVVREEWWLSFKFLLRKNYTYAVYFDEQNIPQGYLVYLLEPGKLTIAEWTWLTGGAFRGLNRFVASHNGSVAKIIYDTGFDGQTLQFLATTPMNSLTIRPEMMARVVDVKRFLNDTKKIQKLSESVAIRVTNDPYAPWNEGIFELRKAATGVEVRQVESTELPVIQLSIQRFTQLFMGYLSPRTLYFHGFLATDERLLKVLEEIVPEQKPVLEDYF